SVRLQEIQIRLAKLRQRVFRRFQAAIWEGRRYRCQTLSVVLCRFGCGSSLRRTVWRGALPALKNDSARSGAVSEYRAGVTSCVDILEIASRSPPNQLRSVFFSLRCNIVYL